MMGNISFGWALVAGKNRVPNPAAGITAFFIIIYKIYGLITRALILLSARISFRNISSSLYMPMIAPPEPENLADAPQSLAVLTISRLLSDICMILHLRSKFLLIISFSKSYS